jgi:three-Cys-motif partner protein
MPYKDLHEKPFDESTIAKLQLFEDYAQAWIPTFVMQSTPTICIFDFFSGTGYDKDGIAGSPIRILQKVNEHIGYIYQKNVKINVYFNEFDKNKFILMKEACANYLDNNKSVNQVITIEYLNEGFETLFPKLLPKIGEFPSLVYLDQNGIKFLSDTYLSKLEKAKQTDFLYFVSTSSFWRFGETDEFKTHLKIDMAEAKKNPYKLIHRNVTNQLRKKLPQNTKLKLYPFSLKKGANIYGIIFGASHPRAVQKFLDIAWKQNKTNGEANFDIDDDELKAQGNLYEDQPLTKIQTFQKNVREKVLAKEISNNVELFDYTLEEGHLGKHAADELKKMKKAGQIFFEGRSPLATYENVYSNKKRKVD